MKARVKASAWKQIPCCPIQLLQIQEWRDWNSPCWVETVGPHPRKAIPTCWVLSIIARASAISFWFIPQRLATFVWHLWCTFMPHAERRSNAVSKGDRINFHTPWTWSVLGAGMSNRQLANPQHHLHRRGRHWRQILGWCFYDATKHHISYIIYHTSYIISLLHWDIHAHSRCLLAWCWDTTPTWKRASALLMARKAAAHLCAQT